MLKRKFQLLSRIYTRNFEVKSFLIAFVHITRVIYELGLRKIEMQEHACLSETEEAVT